MCGLLSQNQMKIMKVCIFDTQKQKKNSLLLGITDRVFICQYFKNANVIRIWERKV